MDAHFVHVGLHDVLDMWLGNSEKNLHGIFDFCRRRSPCVLFFDELDAIGLKRSARGPSASRGVVTPVAGGARRPER
jgi:SpoVK/Ycf46/Vps4 family AAA+-type ATPase